MFFNKAKSRNGLVVLGVLGAISLGGIVFMSTKSDSHTLKVDDSVKQSNSKSLSMYVENIEGKYVFGDSDVFPTEGYLLDTERTTCVNGGTITQDAETLKLRGAFNTVDSCNVFFKREEYYGKTVSAFIVNDDEEYEHLRPEGISVEFYKNGNLYSTNVFNAGNNWRGTISESDSQSWLVRLSEGETERIKNSYSEEEVICDPSVSIKLEGMVFIITVHANCIYDPDSPPL